MAARSFLMPIFSPRRYLPPFYPVRRDDISLPMRLLTAAERDIKSISFGCRMCGNCHLQETAFACPMTCTKGLCGGASPEHCEVDPSRPCTWYMIYRCAERLGIQDRLLEINAPIDGSRAGRETRLDALDKRNLLDKVYVLAALVRLKSARAAHFMANSVPGVKIPDVFIRRMDEADGKDGQQEAGAAIALETIEKLQATQVIAGRHIMAVHWEDIVPRLVTEAGLPRPAA